MVVNAQTKIGVIIKDNPQAIDLLVSLSPHFKKLRNPLLRRLLAPRVTVAEAATIGSCNVETILTGLSQIGFTIGETKQAREISPVNNLEDLTKVEYDVSIDVRLDLNNGVDPFNNIIKKLDEIAAGQTLLVINSFEPAPLIRILKNKGHQISIATHQPDLVYTFITKALAGIPSECEDVIQPADPVLFENILKHYNLKFTEVDVREMEMPKPMIAILDTLDDLKTGEALYVRHKKVPQFLFPELKDRKFSYVYKQTRTEVILIIYHTQV